MSANRSQGRSGFGTELWTLFKGVAGFGGLVFSIALLGLKLSEWLFPAAGVVVIMSGGLAALLVILWRTSPKPKLKAKPRPATHSATFSNSATFSKRVLKLVIACGALVVLANVLALFFPPAGGVTGMVTTLMVGGFLAAAAFLLLSGLVALAALTVKHVKLQEIRPAAPSDSPLSSPDA